MIKIDRIHIRLPAQFESSAAEIARLLGEGLARADIPASATRDRLEVGPVRVAATATARELAGGIMASIRHQLSSNSAPPGGPS